MLPAPNLSWRSTPTAARLTAGYVLDPGNVPHERAATVDDNELLAAERYAALRQALAHLLPSCQDLLALLAADPPLPYAQISARLGIPVGSIGPSRSHFLDKLRHTPAIATLIDAEPARATNEPLQQAVMP
jgi:DNA-directed RNA polymerase specialized sigma24 family protein